MDRITIWCTVYEGSEQNSNSYEHYYDFDLTPDEYQIFRDRVIEKIGSGEIVVWEDLPKSAIQRAIEEIEEAEKSENMQCDDEQFENMHIVYELDEVWNVCEKCGEIYPYFGTTTAGKNLCGNCRYTG